MEKPLRSAGFEMPDDEWRMYERCRCPDEQLPHCLTYEFARECEKMKRWLAWLREKLGTTPQLTANDLLREFPNQSVSAYPTRLFYTTEGKFLTECLAHFPQTPWLRIPPQERARLAKTFWGEKDRSTGKKMFTASGDPELLIERLDAGPLSAIERKVYNYAISIDWTQSNKRLVDRFRLWLECNEPTERQINERRGRTSPRDMLKALAALRLTREHTIEDAETFTQKKIGEPLYADPSNWSKQRKRAEDFISEFGG